MKKLLHYSALWLIALVIMAGAMLAFESDLLWKIQENNLFLYTSPFFREQMLVPGGFLSWIAAFFTQFFYYPWLGTLILCAWWLLLMWLTKKAFNIAGQWAWLAILPVACLLMTIVDMGYWVYVLKLSGHAFVATIATTAVAALLWAFRCLPDRFWLRPAFVLITCLAGYPLMGIYGIAAALLMAVWSWRLKKQPLPCTIAAVLGAAAVPLLFYRFVFYQTNQANLYAAGLPLYYVTEEHHAYYAPFYALAVIFLLLTVVSLKEMKTLRKPVIIGVVTMAVASVLVTTYWFKDENFHRELAMQRAIEQNDWINVISEAAKQKDEPTRAIVMMRNLALSRLGVQGDEMMNYKNGSKAYAAPFGMRLMLEAGPLIYYHYGMLNCCARLCTEMSVEFGWNPAALKLLAKCALLNGERQLARKYLGLLKETLFFADWAERYGAMNGNAETIAADPEMGIVKRMMHYDNMLSADQGNIESFLMHQLANSHYTGDKYFQEQTLLATLWTKDIPAFYRHFSDYIQLHPKDRMPYFYQQAAYLYGQIEERPDIDRLPFDALVKDSYNSFAEAASRFDDIDIDVAREGLKAFSNTYYYDYYLMSQLPEY